MFRELHGHDIRRSATGSLGSPPSPSPNHVLKYKYISCFPGCTVRLYLLRASMIWVNRGCRCGQNRRLLQRVVRNPKMARASMTRIIHGKLQVRNWPEPIFRFPIRVSTAHLVIVKYIVHINVVCIWLFSDLFIHTHADTDLSISSS